ncbi:MAG: M23 family metallopeptidase, partial [Bdellovibrio sp.]
RGIVFLGAVLVYPQFLGLSSIRQLAVHVISSPNLKYGSVFFIKKGGHAPTWFFSSRSLSSMGDYWMGVVGYKKKGVAAVLNEASYLPLKISGIFQRPPSRLRLPAKVWNRVNDRFARQKQKEKDLMRSLLRKPSVFEASASCWHKPLNSMVVSSFASPRRLPNGYSYLHTGVDLRAAEGTPVRAAAWGKVAWVGKMIVPGNLIVLDHGSGIYTRYMHLSRILVHLNQWVRRGDIIGLSGATGRVEAPHLHWEVVWKGIFANPLEFLEVWGRLCNPV